MAGILDGIKEKMDWRKIRVMGGDVPPGEWDYNGGMMTPDPKSGRVECLSLMGEISKLEIQTQDSVKELGKALGFTIAGALIAGPFGAVAGYLASGSRKEVCVLCVLKDGRKFVAVMDQRIYQQMLGLSMM